MVERKRIFGRDRRRLILDEVNRLGSVTVAGLTERFGVSDMTIRRDLELLSGGGMLEKVHGGAVQTTRMSEEPHFKQKRLLNRPEKQAIAGEALGLIEDGSTVAFSAGTTTWHIADALETRGNDLSFITNSTNVALTLQENGWDQIVLSGGIFRTPSDALVGPFAERTLKTLNADVLFLGVHGINPDTGLTTPNIAEAETDRCLVDAAQKVVVVADYTKLGVVALAKIVPLSRVDVLITDDRANREILREIQLLGVRVMIAPS